MKLTKSALVKIIKEEINNLLENETPLQRNRRIRKDREAAAQQTRNKRYADAMGRENTLPYGVSAADHRAAEASRTRKARLQQARDDGRLKEEEMERQPADATWRDSETEAGGIVTTKDGLEVPVHATTSVAYLRKVVDHLEELGVKSITEDGQPEISVLDFLKTKLLYSDNPPDLG